MLFKRYPCRSGEDSGTETIQKPLAATGSGQCRLIQTTKKQTCLKYNITTQQMSNGNGGDAAQLLRHVSRSTFPNYCLFCLFRVLCFHALKTNK